MAGCKNFKERIERRRREAQVRAEERLVRGDTGQLASLEAHGHGDCQEAKRLRAQLENK